MQLHLLCVGLYLCKSMLTMTFLSSLNPYDKYKWVKYTMSAMVKLNLVICVSGRLKLNLFKLNACLVKRNKRLISYDI